jgi:hypothetical protein
MRGRAVVAFEPKPAAKALETAVRAAEAGRAVGTNREMAEFAGIGIGAAENAVLRKDAAAVESVM